MTPTPSADEVFAAALALTDPSARSAYLDRTCAGKAGLREEVESLLAAATRAGTFLESPLTDAAAVLRETSQPIETPLAERAGSRIGRYKLLEQIGEGGFGVVWMAQPEPSRPTPSPPERAQTLLRDALQAATQGRTMRTPGQACLQPRPWAKSARRRRLPCPP